MSIDTKNDIKLEEGDNTSKMPEINIKSEIDELQLENMEVIIKEELQINQYM